MQSRFDPSTASAAAVLGEGRYVLQALLGEGRRKRVYRARDTHLERDVALAVLKTEGLDEGGLARLRDEVRAIRRLGTHPHIVPVHDVGEEAGEPYVVSQCMEGGSAADRLAAAGARGLPLDEALRIGDQLCRALEHVHAHGLVHRDVKPGNVWLAADGTAKLGDFGLAVDAAAARVTQEGLIVGSAGYLPPEQALGRRADARSDLYALGATLYELLTGRLPFPGEDAVTIISQHLHARPVAPSCHEPAIPPGLDALVLALLAKSPDQRPASAAAVREALAAAPAAPAVAAAAPNPLDRLAGGVFVGREQATAELRAAFEEASAGRGGVALLVGEAGIGKTRTAEELVTYARLRDAQVLWGRCFEGGGAPAFWPWVQIVRTALQRGDRAALRADLGAGAADIGRFVPEVRAEFPDLPDPPELEPEQARFRLFDSVTAFLRNLAVRQPLVLALDDLHWADKPSLLLLQFLARELTGARILVLGTCRDELRGRADPLTQTLAALARADARRIALGGFGPEEIARLVEMSAGIRPPAALVASMHRETDGNPFFLTELVRLLAADGRLARAHEAATWSLEVPQGVREVILRRLDGLSGDANQALTLAAVVGREFGLDVLEPLSAVAGERLLELLEEALAARVIVEVPRQPGRYRFAHALVRETLYEELSATRRVRVHRSVGEVLESLHGRNLEPHLAALAYHFAEGVRAGGDAERAIDYARRAGDRATAMLAYEEAATHYERALHALEARPPLDETRRCALLLALADARRRAGERALAREAYLAAADVARRLGAAAALAHAALGAGSDWIESGQVDAELLRLLEEASAALGEGDGALRARVLARLAMELYFTTEPARQATLGREAVEVARASGDRSALAAALYGRLWSLMRPEHTEERLAIATELQAVAKEAGDRERAMRAIFMRFASLLELGDMTQASALIDTHTRLVAELNQPLYLFHSATFRGMRSLAAGRFAEAEELAAEALAQGQRAQYESVMQSWAVQLYVLRREQGRLDELLAPVQGMVQQYPGIAAWRCALALVHAEGGRAVEARAEFEVLAREGFTALRRDVSWLIGLAELAETCAFLGDAERAATLYELMLPHAERGVVIGYAVAYWGAAAQYLGQLATTMRRWEDAERHFARAFALNERMGARPMTARAQLACARMLLARDGPADRRRALDLLGTVLETAHALGMTRLLEQAVALKLAAQGVDARDVARSIDAVVAAVQGERPDLHRAAAPDGTVTILFSDIEGYTELTERLGDRRVQEILHAHNAVVRAQVSAYGGYEVKSAGDGFMLAFRSARRAVACAVAIQHDIAAYNVRHPDEPIRVRMGLHTGEAIREADDFYGKTVILAARIAGAARGGEVLVSSPLKQLAESAGDVRFRDPREVALKGLRDRYEVYAVEWAAA